MIQDYLYLPAMSVTNNITPFGVTTNLVNWRYQFPEVTWSHDFIVIGLRRNSAWCQGHPCLVFTASSASLIADITRFPNLSTTFLIWRSLCCLTWTVAYLIGSPAMVLIVFLPVAKYACLILLSEDIENMSGLPTLKSQTRFVQFMYRRDLQFWCISPRKSVRAVTFLLVFAKWPFESRPEHRFSWA